MVCDSSLHFNVTKDEAPQLSSSLNSQKTARTTYEQKCNRCYSRGYIHSYITFWCRGLKVQRNVHQLTRNATFTLTRFTREMQNLENNWRLTNKYRCVTRTDPIPLNLATIHNKSKHSSQNERRLNGEALYLWRHSARHFWYHDIQATEKETFLYLIKLHNVSSRKGNYVHSRYVCVTDQHFFADDSQNKRTNMYSTLYVYLQVFPLP